MIQECLPGMRDGAQLTFRFAGARRKVSHVRFWNHDGFGGGFLYGIKCELVSLSIRVRCKFFGHKRASAAPLRCERCGRLLLSLVRPADPSRRIP